MKTSNVVAILLVAAAVLGGASWLGYRQREGGETGGTAEPVGQRALEIRDGDMESLGAGVVLVDFWAPWCPPCRAQGPVVNTLAGRFSGRAAVAKLNVDENQETAGRYGVNGIPTLIIFRDGKEVERFVGLQSEEKLAAALERAIEGG